MEGFTNKSWEISGILSCFPLDSNSFKEIQIEGISDIGDSDPAIRHLIRISANTTALSTHITATPVSTSYEGYNMTGHKLIVEGKLEFRVEYMPYDPIQPVHTVSFNKSINTGIILDISHTGSSDMIVNTYIEDIYIRLVNERRLYFCVLLLLDAVSQVTL